jgi:hypothetical protein
MVKAVVLLIWFIQLVVASSYHFNDISRFVSARKVIMRNIATSSIALASFIAVQTPIETALAADAKVLIYKSGKSPTPPNQSDPKKGTKKDSTFLRCISDCKTRCQRPGEGLAKNDCVQDCQDQCCASYEQCSFKIKTTAGGEL